MKIVVIGGSGLIGKKLVSILRRKGHEAVAADIEERLLDEKAQTAQSHRTASASGGPETTATSGR